MGCRIILVFAALAACAHAVDISLLNTPVVKARLLKNEHGGLNLMVQRKGVSQVITVIGRHAGAIKDVVEDGDVVIQFANDTSVRISTDEIVGEHNGQVITVTWEAPRSTKLQDCVNLVVKYLKKPTGIPDERMITYPIWSTWARYKTDVNHDVIMKFADEVNSNGFPNSQLEIDDLWEICYGSLTVDVRRFPDMKNTVDRLREKGFRSTMWAHPFLNKGCEPWYSEAKSKGYLVESEYGSVETSWWNDNETTTAYIDFTKPEARQWYIGRLEALQKSSGIDSYKFDGGESSWSPQIPVLKGEIRDQPGVITADYVRAVAQFAPMAEVRAGYRTQDLPIFVRMIDKDTYWTFENGLPTLITTLLQLNINGYPLVLPDMIGGNGYNEPPSKELFIRWLQANTFMPSLQFSYVPWDFDNETIAISKKYVEMHAAYSPQIVSACERAVAEGAPVNAPLWWIAPNDTATYDIADQYLLGETIVVAPVIERGATSRDVYLPAGAWLAQGDSDNKVQGGDWLRDYPAPLDTLPFFVKA